MTKKPLKTSLKEILVIFVILAGFPLWALAIFVAAILDIIGGRSSKW